jgi:antitoxin YefM
MEKCEVEEDVMEVVNYSDARANLKGVMDRVVNDRTHVVITRQKAEAVVIVSLEDWNAMAETMHLLSTAANAERLRESIRELDGGGGTERELLREREATA